MSDEVKSEGNPLEDTVKALQEQIAGLTGQIESLKPKPNKTDRDVLDDIAAGIGSLAEVVGKLVPGTPAPTPKPEGEGKPAEEKPKRKTSIFYR